MSSNAKSQLDVDVQANELEGGRVELQVRVPPEPVEKMRKRVLREFARRTDIPGFRKGKAPRAIVERFVDEDALRQQIADSLVEDAYEAAVQKCEFQPLDRADVGEPEFTDDGALAFTATFTKEPEIELGEYKGLKVTREVTRVTDQQLESDLDRLRRRRARYEELSEGAHVENGDLVIVDYDMFVDGEKREEASASGYPLEVGKDQLFPEMNEALLGASVGETREFEITYPENHSDESLRGKTAQFKATAREARRRVLPELNDEFAKQVSDQETLDDLRGLLRQRLEALSKLMADERVDRELVRRVSEGATLDVPQALVDRETRNRMDEVEQELDRRDVALPQYLERLGRSFEDWRADIERNAREGVRSALVLDQIGEAENIQVTEDDIHAEISRRAERQGVEEARVREQLADPAEMRRLVNHLYHGKIVDFLRENAEITEEVIEPEVEESEAEGEGGKGAGAIEEQ